jgi:hypothetical protein
VYSELTGDERGQVNDLLNSRLVSPDNCTMLVSTTQCCSPKDGYYIRVADEEHAMTTVYDKLVEHRGQSSHHMAGLVIDPEFNTKAPGGKMNRSYRMHLREQMSHPSSGNLEVQVIGGHHTMLAKKAMLKEGKWKNHEPITSMSMHVYCNLPPAFAKYVGDEHNKVHETQLQTTLGMRLKMVRQSWVKAKESMNLGEHESKSYNFISKFLETRSKNGIVSPWPPSKNTTWRKDIVAEAWNKSKTDKISGPISNLISAAQRSDSAWGALMGLIGEIDR